MYITLKFLMDFDSFSRALQLKQTRILNIGWPCRDISLNEIHVACKRLKLTPPKFQRRVTRRLITNCYQKYGNYRYFLGIVLMRLISRFYSSSEILQVFIQSTYNLPCGMIKFNKGSNEKKDIEFHKTLALSNAEGEIYLSSDNAKTFKFAKTILTVFTFLRAIE